MRFLGSNIASEVLKQKNDLLIYDNLSRIGGEDNLSWLKSIGNFEFIKADTNNFPKISEVIKIISRILYIILQVR